MSLSRQATLRPLLAMLAAAALLTGCSDNLPGTAAPAGGSPTAAVDGSGPPSSDGSPSTGSPADGSPADGSPSADGPAGGGPVDDNAVSGAQAGLATWLEANRPANPTTSTDIEGCPLLDLAEVQSALTPLGVTEELHDWSTEIEWRQYTDLDPELLGVICGADSDGDVHDTPIGTGASITAIDLAGRSDFDALVELYDLDADLGLELTNLPAGDTAGACMEEGCMVLWGHGDGLVLGAFLLHIDGVDEAAVAQVLDTIGPAMLATMAGH